MRTKINGLPPCSRPPFITMFNICSSADLIVNVCLDRPVARNPILSERDRAKWEEKSEVGCVLVSSSSSSCQIPNQPFVFFQLSFLSLFLENLLISGEPILASGDSFNVNLVNEKLSSFPATDLIRHNDMANRQKPRRHEQSHLQSSGISSSACIRYTEHVGSLQRDKHQGQQ